MFLSQPQHWQGLYVVANPADKAAITKLRKVIMLGPSSNVTRIVKAALHKSPGKSNLNVNFVFYGLQSEEYFSHVFILIWEKNTDVEGSVNI